MPALMKKMRTLYVMQILLEKTDKDHPIKMDKIMELLNTRYEIEADRKTLYRDIDLIEEYGKEMGFTLERIRGSNPGYMVTKRNFDLAELKLLVDVVQASNFITRSKSDQLIRKIRNLASENEAKLLTRQVFIQGRPKADNETIYEIVDVIYEALARNKQILFKYQEWQTDKKLHVKKKGADYVVSPWALIWDDENYYLLAYDMLSDQERHYRVDKMLNIRLSDADREKNELFDGNLAEYSKKTFGMFGGEDVKVTLRGKSYLAGTILDRFGSDIMMIRHGADEFQVPLTVKVSQQFFGWLTGLGPDIQIVSPEYVRQNYAQYLKDIMKNYES